MDSTVMRTALAQLDQALFSHEQWSEAIYSTLICRLPPDERDVDRDAHRKCRFGQWYYGSGSLTLHNHPGFVEIAVEHERMHQFAATLLRASTDNVPISLHDYERFVAAMKRMRLEALTMKRELEDSLNNLDPLTDATNRTGMLTRLREQLELVKRGVHSCSVAMMDVDYFKKVNDTYGHGMGDQVLAAFSRYVIAHLRPYDNFFRYGGEEFVICAPNADLATSQGLLERLRVELASIPFRPEGRPPFHVTASFGLTLLDPDLSVEQSIDRADKALYAAKSAGRNRIVVWTPSML